MLDAPTSAGDQHFADALAILIGDQNASEAERADLALAINLLAGYLKDDREEPRPKKVYNDLDSIYDLARKLERGIRQLDPRTRDFLFQETNRTYAPDLALEVCALLSIGRRRLHPLLALAEMTSQVKEAFDTLAGKDKGGPTTTLKDRLWAESSRARHVDNCAMLLAQCRGFEAISGTIGGALHRLSIAIWLYAMGDNTEPALDPHVKTAAAAIRKKLG